MEPISTLSFIGLVVTLIIGIMKEFFSARARAREVNAKFEIDKKKFLEFVDNSISKLRDETKAENGKIGDVEDRVGDDLNKK